MIELVGGIGLGFGVGILTMYLLGVKPLEKKICSLRYDGFRPETPIEPRPKTVPFPDPNET